MAAISFNDGISAPVLRNVYPSPANRFSNWTPITRPYGDAVNTLASGATVMVRYRTDYGASFDLPGLGIVNAPRPSRVAISFLQTGGLLTAGTYYYKITAIDVNGETGASSEVSATITTSTGVIGLGWAPVAGASTYRIYRGTSAGAESLYYTSSTNAFQDDGNPANTGASTAGTPPVAGINLVAIADRLIAHLLGGGMCSVSTEDVLASTYATCGLYPGTTPSLRLTDSRNLLYTLSLQLINLAGSPVAMHCVYAP
jgi:hypothetical protein